MRPRCIVRWCFSTADIEQRRPAPACPCDPRPFRLCGTALTKPRSMPFPAVHPALDRALAARGYAEPTPTQLAVVEADQNPERPGADMLVSAQTGSGKTVAFGLALASSLLGEAERFDVASQPLALIIAPTRELAMQISREFEWLYADTGARIVQCVGGMSVRAEQQQLSRGAHIVIGTPGRLCDHLTRGFLDLSSLKVAVLDEADEMLDLGFR